MKIHLPTVLLLALAFVAGCNKTAPHADTVAATPPAPTRPPTYSSFDTAPDSSAIMQAHTIRFQEADLSQVLELYGALSGRTLIRSPQVPMGMKITIDNATALTRTEVLQMLDNVFAANQVVMVYLGAHYVKVVSVREAMSEAGRVFDGPWRQLPDSSSFVTYIVKLKSPASETAISTAMPFAKLPNSIIGFKNSDVIILRDYAANVRRMMEVLERVDLVAEPSVKAR